jgi:cytolysin (calcineurin-like family phosphatase)
MRPFVLSLSPLFVTVINSEVTENYDEKKQDWNCIHPNQYIILLIAEKVNVKEQSQTGNYNDLVYNHSWIVIGLFVWFLNEQQK